MNKWKTNQLIQLKEAEEEMPQMVCDLTAEFLNIPYKIKVEINAVRRGRARTGTRKITLPRWALERGEVYTLYYTVHEVCHFVCAAHGTAFKEVEMEVLEAWGIRPKYKKVYLRELCSVKENVCLYCGEMQRGKKCGIMV